MSLRDRQNRGLVCDFAHEFDADNVRGRWRPCHRQPHYSWIDCVWGVVWGCRRTDPFFQMTTIDRDAVVWRRDMLDCVHCKKKVEYDDAKMCRQCEGPLCAADCVNKVACEDYLDRVGRAADEPHV